MKLFPSFFKIATVLFLICLSGLRHPLAGQDLNISVQVDRSRINNASLNYLNDFGTTIETYLNDYDWVQPAFEKRERIQATIQITLLSVDNNYNFSASIVIRSQRPIYNTLQQTTLLFYNDENWSFNYTPNRALVHDELQFDAVATLLDYYAYLIIGYDSDSFSELGGTPYFSEAQQRVSLAQTTGSPGWSRTGNVRRNRAQLIADLLGPNYALFRKAVYRYHRLGLDQFLYDPPAARQQILQALQMILEARRNTTNNLLFDTFFNAKYRELVSVFEDAETEVRLKAYEVLSDVDQSHLSEYKKLQ